MISKVLQWRTSPKSNHMWLMGKGKSDIIKSSCGQIRDSQPIIRGAGMRRFEVTALRVSIDWVVPLSDPQQPQKCSFHGQNPLPHRARGNKLTGFNHTPQPIQLCSYTPSSGARSCNNLGSVPPFGRRWGGKKTKWGTCLVVFTCVWTATRALMWPWTWYSWMRRGPAAQITRDTGSFNKQARL